MARHFAFAAALIVVACSIAVAADPWIGKMRAGTTKEQSFGGRANRHP
jgi:hypothetical protein